MRSIIETKDPAIDAPTDTVEQSGEAGESRESWFTAYMLYAGQLDEEENGLPVRESIVLVQARSSKEAWEEAEKIGRRREGEALDLPQGAGYAHFVGVRKLEPLDRDIMHGTEVAVLDLEVGEEGDVERLLEGGFVRVVYEF